MILERFRPKVITIEERKDIDLKRVDELVGSIQTYEMTFLNSKKSVFEAFKNEKKEIENLYDLIKDELAYRVK